MDLETFTSDFSANAFSIVNIQDLMCLEECRCFVSDWLCRRYQTTGEPSYILNTIHEHIPNLSDSVANQLVLDLINDYKKDFSMSHVVYNMIGKAIASLLGPDIAAQRNPNFVFQHPNSERYSELHTDTPGNSPFEIVTWIPLVDCYSTKSFYILPYSHSLKLSQLYKDEQIKSWSIFRSEAIKNGQHLNIKYGQALIFWSGLLHGSLINKTSESRFSLNVRFKNLFAPHGLKDPLQFYTAFKVSTLSDFGLQYI